MTVAKTITDVLTNLFATRGEVARLSADPHRLMQIKSDALSQKLMETRNAAEHYPWIMPILVNNTIILSYHISRFILNIIIKPAQLLQIIFRGEQKLINRLSSNIYKQMCADIVTAPQEPQDDNDGIDFEQASLIETVAADPTLDLSIQRTTHIYLLLKTLINAIRARDANGEQIHISLPRRIGIAIFTPAILILAIALELSKFLNAVATYIVLQAIIQAILFIPRVLTLPSIAKNFLIRLISDQQQNEQRPFKGIFEKLMYRPIHALQALHTDLELTADQKVFLIQQTPHLHPTVRILLHITSIITTLLKPVWFVIGITTLPVLKTINYIIQNFRPDYVTLLNFFGMHAQYQDTQTLSNKYGWSYIKLAFPTVLRALRQPLPETHKHMAILQRAIFSLLTPVFFISNILFESARYLNTALYAIPMLCVTLFNLPTLIEHATIRILRSRSFVDTQPADLSVDDNIMDMDPAPPPLDSPATTMAGQAATHNAWYRSGNFPNLFAPYLPPTSSSSWQNTDLDNTDDVFPDGP